MNSPRSCRQGVQAGREKLLVKEKEYRFGGPDGQASLEDLFAAGGS